MINAGQTIIIDIVAENPSVAADYKIHVFSYSSSHNAPVDEAYSYITIINQGKGILIALEFTMLRCSFKIHSFKFSTMGQKTPIESANTS